MLLCMIFCVNGSVWNSYFLKLVRLWFGFGMIYGGVCWNSVSVFMCGVICGMNWIVFVLVLIIVICLFLSG